LDLEEHVYEALLCVCFMYFIFLCYSILFFYGSSGGSGCFFSTSLLVSMMCIRYLIALWCMFFNVFFVFAIFILRGLWWGCIFVSWCMAPQAPVVMTIRGAIIHSLFLMFSIRDAYLVSFSMIFSGTNLLLQYVNSINWMVIYGVGCVEGVLSCGWFSTSNIFGFSLALHWHGFVGQIHGRSQWGTMLSCGLYYCCVQHSLV
jgi:hypothetical protein